jgi:uncharacterized protein
MLDAMQTIADKAYLAMATAVNVPSPCVSVCQMAFSSGLCEGCLRTIDEVAGWSVYSDAEKREVWSLIGLRAKEAQPRA